MFLIFKIPMYFRDVKVYCYLFFTLNEGVSKMKAIDFEGHYAKLIKKCTSLVIT